jgi:hypothetical protein
MKNTWIKRAATLGLTAGILSLPLAALAAEEMVIETPKVYTPAKVNGVDGFWVEYQKKTYQKRAAFADPVGPYDQMIQNLYVEIFGPEVAQLTKAQRDALYAQYGIPKGFNGLTGDYNFFHNEFLSKYTDRIKADLQYAKRLVDADSPSAVVAAMGAQATLDQVYKAFANSGYAGNNYVVNARSVEVVHGISYVDQSRINPTVFNANKGLSLDALLRTNPGAIKGLEGASYIDSLVNAARFSRMAELAAMNLLPVNMIDQQIVTPGGPVDFKEDTPNAARLNQLASFLVTASIRTHSPIALDLNGDGKIGVTGTSTAQKRFASSKFVAKNSVWFDIGAEGKKKNIEWLDRSGDGFLVDDSYGRLSKALTAGGTLDGTFLFGDSIGYTHGYHKLAVKKVTVNVASTAQIDENTNWSKLFNAKPVLKGKDLNGLKVWVDANGDAKLQANELKTLASLGITEIGSAPQTIKNAKGEYLIQSYFVQNGKKRMTEDVWFAENPDAAQ